MSLFPRPALRLHPPAPEVGADGPLSGSHPLGVSAASESSGRRWVLLLLLPSVFLLLGRCGGLEASACSTSARTQNCTELAMADMPGSVQGLRSDL